MMSKWYRQPPRALLLTLTLLSVALKLWLVAAQPVVARGDAGYDDRLFLELTNHLLDGDWLGPYSQFTLMKGPMYSLWIAGVFWLGIPVPLGQHLMYLLGCAMLVRSLQPYLRPGWQTLGLFTLLWWQPMSYVQLDLLRQNIYTPLTLLLFAGLFALETRRSAPAAIRFGWGALLGLCAAGFWLTREESVWILPGALLLFSAALWSAWRSGKDLHPLVLPIITATACAGILMTSVCALNYRYYNWFGTVEFRAPEFLSAYGALQRPIPAKEVPYVPVTREARLKLYEVSPAFAELRPWIEGAIGREWAVSSEFVTGHPADDREIGGGWFLWALRDAVIAARHPRTAREALDFYDRIATEVNRACDDGRLGATLPRRDTMMPPWRAEHAQRFRKEALSYLGYFFLFREFTANPEASSGSAQMLQIFRELTRWPLALPHDAPELGLPLQWRVDHWRVAVLQHIGDALCWLCAAVAITGVGAWLWAMVRMTQRRGNFYIFVVSIAALGSAVAVYLVNLLVHVLAFPNQSPSALAQGYPLLLLFGATAWMAALETRTAAADATTCTSTRRSS